MPSPLELTRRCPYCSAYPAVFTLHGGSVQTVGADGNERLWNAAACPGCGGLIVLEVERGTGNVLAAYPTATGEWQVEHLPPSVEPLWTEAAGVYQGGHHRSAVVQCGAALEAAFEAMNVGGRTLVESVKEARSLGLLTSDLEEAVQYARLIRNAGAHGRSAVRVVSSDSARGAMRFTQQVLRVLFEVPGELETLTGKPPELQADEDEDEPNSSG